MSGYTGEDVIQRGLLDPGAPFQQKPFTPGGAGAQGPGDARRARVRRPGGAGQLGDRPGLGVRAAPSATGPELEVVGAEDEEAARRSTSRVSRSPAMLTIRWVTPGKDRRDVVPDGRR